MKRYSEDEEVYLEYFVYGNDEKILEAAKFLNRSYESVNQKLHQMRKNNKKMKINKRRWTKQEDDYLEKHYKTMTNKNLSMRLNRSYEAIKSRKSFLGLKTTKPVHVHKKRIIELINKGYYRPQIAKELDIDEKSLSNFLRIKNIHCPHVPYDVRTKKMKDLEGFNVRKSSNKQIVRD